jgi:small subunit ribosomal protein S3
MGQKIHPYGLRLGIIKPWQSRWYSKDNYKTYLLEDEKIRRFIRGFLKRKPTRASQRDRYNDPALSRIEIERQANRCTVKLHTAKPGVVIGHRGADIEALQKALSKFAKRDVRVTVEEIRNPNLDATLVAESIAQQIERRIAFRRAIRMTLQRVMKDGAVGCKIMASGRLAGADIARHEQVRDGKVPLHTLRADIDYGVAEASTTYGNIGIKCWIYRGDIIGDMEQPTQNLVRRGRDRDRDRDGDRRPRRDGDRGGYRGGSGGGDRGPRRDGGGGGYRGGGGYNGPRDGGNNGPQAGGTSAPQDGGSAS